MDNKFTTDQILKEAVISFKENCKYFVILGCVYSLILLAFGRFFEPTHLDNFMLPIFISIVMLLIYAKLAIMVHRTVLMQELDLLKMFSWSIKEVKFVFLVIGLYLLAVLFISVFSAIFIPLFVGSGKPNDSIVFLVPILIFFGLIVVARVSLVFPAIAIRKNLRYIESWKKTKGHTFSLFLLLILVPFITSFVQNKLVGDSTFLSIVFTFISVFTLIFEVTILSHCFIAFYGEDEDTENNTYSKM